MAGVVMALVVGVGVAGCGEGPGRTQARANLIEQLVGEGLTDSIATCIVDAFFEGKSDDELQAFYARKQLTDGERAEFVSLGARCGA